MKLNELFAHLDSTWPTDTVDTSWPPSSDPADLAAQAVDAIEVEDVVTEVGADGTVTITGTLTLAPTWVPDETTFVSHLFPSLRFQFAPEAGWKSAFRASVSPADVRTIQIDELPLKVLLPADLLRVHPEESERGEDDGIELAEAAGDTVVERVFAFGIEADGTVRLDAHMPISVGPCAVFGLPAKGVHEIVLVSAPRKAKESADWIVRDLDHDIIAFDGGALGFGGIELDWTAEGSSLQDVRQRLHIADGAEIVMEDLVIPSVLLPPVPLHGTLGVRHVLNPDEPLAHAISFADAPITIPLGSDASVFISQLFVSTPPDGEDWWSGLTIEGGVSFGSGSGDDSLAVTIGLIDGDVLRLGFEKTPPGSNIPIIHLDLWKITVDITGIKLGVSLVELAEEHPEAGDAIQALSTIYIKEKPGESSASSGDVGITDESGAPFEAALVDIGWDRGKPTGNMVLARAQLHLSMFVLEVQEMGLAFEHGATYISISGGIRVKSDPFEGGVWFTRLRGKLSGNPDAPGFQLGGIGLELAVEDVVRITAHGMYRDDVLPDGTRIKEQGLGGGLVIKAGGNEWGLTVDLFWGTRIPTTGEEQNYLLFLIAFFGAIPMGPIELRGIEALYGTGLVPKIDDGDREAGELKYYSWLKRARPTALPEGRGLEAWKPTKDAWAFGLGVGLSITGAGSVFQLKAFGAGFDSPEAAGLVIVIEFGMFGSKKPLALGVFEYDFTRDAFVLMIQLDVDLKDFVDNWPKELKVKVGGTLTFGNKPGLVALGRLNDPDTWLGARLELELTQLFQLKLRVGICFEWQENVQVGGGLTVSLTITGSLGVITLQGWGALEVLVRYMLSGTNDFVARIRLELGFAVVLFGFLRFGIAIEALAEWLANMPNYFVFRITFRFETPWFLPDVSYTTEVVTGSLEPETRAVATSPLLESSAQSLTGSRRTRVFRVDHGSPGDKTALASVNDLAGASGGWSGDLGDPVPLDATIEIDFSVMVSDGLGLGLDESIPDLGLQVSGDGEMELTTSYRLARIQVLRSPRGENAWETIEDLTSAASPRNLRWSWDQDTRVNGKTAPKRLLLNGKAPFTVGIDNPLADAEILNDNPSYPCCQVRRPDVARFDFQGESVGPLPAGFVRDLVYEDRGSVAPVRIHGAPCVVVPPTATGATATVVGAFPPSSRTVATVSAAEDLAVASVRLAIAGRHKARLIVVAFDREGTEVERHQVDTGASAFQDIELDPGRTFATIVVSLEDLEEAQEDGSGAASLRLDSVECVTARDRQRFEDERDRCERESTDGHAGTVTFLARHDYQIILTTEVGVKHTSTNQVTSTITERVGFTTAGPPGLNETPEPGLELEPYIVSHTPGGRGITYREESVHLVLSDALKVFGPGSGTGETDFRLPITIAVESAFDANPAAHSGKSSRASADWFVAHRGEADPWVTNAVLGIALALAHDGTSLRYRALTEASAATCPPDDTWVERQPRVGVEPFDPAGRPLWEPRASYVAVMRLEGSPVVERLPFEAADTSSFSATSGSWSVVDGVLRPGGSATGAFGDADWDLYRVAVRGSLSPAGEIGVVVLADAAAVSHGLRAILRRGADDGGALVVETATGSALGSTPVAMIGSDSTLVVEVFADAVRCSVGEAVVSVPRDERGPGSCQLLATGADIVSLRVHGVDMYRQPFRTSAYESFAEHVATCSGLDRHDVGAAAEPLASVRARLSGAFAAAMDPAAPDADRETAFGEAASALAVPLREDADRLYLTCMSAGADRWLLLETPEPMDFAHEVELRLTRKVVSQGVSPADRARLGLLIEYALQHPTPSPFPLPWRDQIGARRLVLGNRVGGILDAPGRRKAAFRAHLDGKYLALDDLHSAAESRVRAPSLGREDRELLAEVTWTLNAQLQIISWDVPVHVSWVDQPCAVIQNATASHALVIPGGTVVDGDYRLDLAITRHWYDTLDAVGPANAYLDDARLAFTLTG